MKRVFFGVFLTIGGIGSVLAIAAARQVMTIRPNVNVAGIEVGGLTTEDAARKLRVWWEEEKRKPLKVKSDVVKSEFPEMTASEIGVTLDDEASVGKLPMQSALDGASHLVIGQDLREQSFEPIYKLNGVEPVVLEETIRKAVGKPSPARVHFQKGQIMTAPEVTAETLDTSKLVEAVAVAIKDDSPVEVPLTVEPKHVPDDALAEIKEVVSEFHTHFPRGMINRNSNIKLASSKLNGIILMPGEQLSFNKTVGERTIKHGFKLAGVYKNGKHDTGIGGGICQVSTTLYNASLFGNLKIVRRSNHSMPVAYVPLGRDATVDYGSLDLVVENDYQTPIAVTSEFQPGTLTFRILGKKEPGESVKIIQVGGKSWDNGVQVTHDPKLRPGATVLVDKGSRGHSIRTYRLLYKNGVLVKKQPLGFSFYGASDKIIAVGPPVAAVPGAPLIQGTKASAPLPRVGN